VQPSEQALSWAEAMTPLNDARATWELLSEPERKALAVLGRYNGYAMTPDMLGRELGVTWQRASRTARKLKEFGLVTVKSLPKQTSYGISGQGEACLAAGAEA
jgi:DNA-binding MarR family transcriptional regulator